MQSNLRIAIIFLLIIVYSPNLVVAQDSVPVNNQRLSLKVFGALVNGTPYMSSDNQLLFVKQRPKVGISISYQFFKNLNSTMNVAYLNPYRAIPLRDGTSTQLLSAKSSVWYYGISFSYDVLPVIFNTNRIRFDVYPILSTNYVHEKWMALDSRIRGSSTFWEYGGGIGLGYNLNNHVGIFTEFLWGNFYNYDKFQVKAGLRFKL